MFRTVPLSIISSFFTVHSHAICHTVLLTACEQDQYGSCSQAVSKHLWHIPLLCVQWKTPDDGQRNCPKHVDFHSKNKFVKLVHLFGFIIRINYNNIMNTINPSKSITETLVVSKNAVNFPCIHWVSDCLLLKADKLYVTNVLYIRAFWSCYVNWLFGVPSRCACIINKEKILFSLAQHFITD